jgi:hypothetical protein
MVRSMLRAGAWPAVTGVSGAALVVGGCGVAFPACATRAARTRTGEPGGPAAAGVVLILMAPTLLPRWPAR